ncbi:MAG: Gfo/Idh/MocA family oxidoreductase [Gammaproteobacteria bacterium]|nr:Gfo/Idh/MocA family oxidoreductase [Gammaproteobacteria bacterium]
MAIESSNSSTGPWRQIRLGMVGGGQGAFIGAVHRIAARLDNRFQLVAAALSSNPQRALASGEELGLASDRNYDNFNSMARAESGREDGIDVVSIVTPNHVHFAAAKAFLEAGIHIICDKPLVTSAAEARELSALAKDKGLLFAVTYNYSGYPMVRQARELATSGTLGELRVVQVEYPQDWLTTAAETTGLKQAEWRTDPQRAGSGGCIGDIGSHAYHLACYVSGLKLESLCAELTTFVEGRQLDDNAQIMLRFEGGARGLLWSSQVAPGNENGLRLRLYGSEGGLEWKQENPNQLWYTPFSQPTQLITRSGNGASDCANRLSRIPPGHPEGYLEGFANIYSEVAEALQARIQGSTLDTAVDFPTVDDGVLGVEFIEAAVASSGAGAKWVSL